MLARGFSRLAPKPGRAGLGGVWRASSRYKGRACGRRAQRLRAAAGTASDDRLASLVLTHNRLTKAQLSPFWRRRSKIFGNKNLGHWLRASFESPWGDSGHQPNGLAPRLRVNGLDSNRYGTYTWSVAGPLGRSPKCQARTDRLEEENRVVTKKEIVRTISEEIGLTQLQTKNIVQKTFDAIVEALVTDRRIELRNFGVFEVKRRAPRKARNPRSGEKVYVPEKFVVTFKPGKEMEERVRELERQQAAAARGPSPEPQAIGASAGYDASSGDG